jgi:hypothetical protein
MTNKCEIPSGSFCKFKEVCAKPKNELDDDYQMA